MRLLRDRRLLGYVCMTLVGLMVLADWLGAPDAGRGCRIAHVVDGDTLELACPRGRRMVRISGMDAPETRQARCPEEAALGVAARDRLRQILAGGEEMRFIEEGHDRYGRVLMQIRVGGRDVAERMIGEGLATAYDGGARIDWCERISGG